MSTDCIVSEYKETSGENENFKGGISNDTTFESKKSELEYLIEILKKGVKQKESGIKYIKYPTLLIEALGELNGLVGMHRLKDSVALQTVQLIERMKMGEKSTAMLNACLSGPPGVGKSKVGVILAKIWFSLGFLNKGGETTTIKKTIIENPLKGGNDMSAIVLLLIAWLGTYVIQMISYTYNMIGLFWLGLIFGLIILIAVFIFFNNSNKPEWIKKYLYEEHTTEENLKNLSDRDIISVVSRNDMIGEFLGHTSGKTKKLLEANIGKVLFIDEAYSLLNDPRDAYGYECLNTLNLFLSENPDKIVVIFAGYKEQMENSIFLAQPGLKRRVMWGFNCDPYNGEELAEIFFIQAHKDGWSISSADIEKIRKLIINNESSFPAYGGDTEKLVYLSSIEVSRSNFSNVSDSLLSCEKIVEKKKILTFESVKKGLISLKENKF